MAPYDMIVQRIHRTHQGLIETTSELPEARLNRRPSQTAPPIGWHLWHIARFADMLQASLFKDLTGVSREIWETEALARQWGLDTQTLGVWGTGIDMSPDAAASLSIAIGQDRLLAYARRVFGLVDQIVADLKSDQFDQPRQNSRTHGLVGGELIQILSKDTTIGAELVFHVSHAGRHLGMIEALRGIFEMNGTATL